MAWGRDRKQRKDYQKYKIYPNIIILLNIGVKNMSSNNLIGAFIQFFNILGHNIEEQQQLYNGIRIAQFLLTIPQMDLPYADMIKDKEIRGACLNNMKIIAQAIEKYHRHVLANKLYQVQFNVYEIYTEYNQQQLIKLLKECFMLVTKATNSSYFIQKILLLDEQVQVLFAQLICQDKSYLISPIRQQIQRSFEENSSNTSRDYNGEKHKQQENKYRYENNQALDLIDKLYECELQNQKLLSEHKKSFVEASMFKQQIQQLSIQVQTLKEHNQNLKKDLYEHQEQIGKLRATRLDKDRQYNKNKQCRKQLEAIIAASRQQIEIMKIQHDVAKCKYENTLVELQRQLSRQQDNNMRLREQIQFYQAELEKIITKYEQYQQQIKQTTKIMRVLEQENKTLHQNQTTLKFQISYKNQQISQFKQLIANIHTNPRRHSYDIDKDDYDYDSRSNATNSKMLASQFGFANTGSTPNLRASIRTDVDEVRALRNQLKELQKQYDKCKGYKGKVRELEYQKNKLVKILRQFQTSRGEQNQIMTGCLYELQLKLAHNKISFSRSTLGEDITNQIR